MKGLLAFITAVMCVVVVCLSAANAGEQSITLNLKDASIQDAISSLFSKSGGSYKLEDGVKGSVHDLSLNDVPFESALKTILKTCDLKYEVKDGVYVIAPEKPESAAPSSKSSSGPEHTDSPSTPPGKPSSDAAGGNVVHVRGAVGEQNTTATVLVPSQNRSGYTPRGKSGSRGHHAGRDSAKGRRTHHKNRLPLKHRPRKPVAKR